MTFLELILIYGVSLGFISFYYEKKEMSYFKEGDGVPFFLIMGLISPLIAISIITKSLFRVFCGGITYFTSESRHKRLKKKKNREIELIELEKEKWEKEKEVIDNINTSLDDDIEFDFGLEEKNTTPDSKNLL